MENTLLEAYDLGAIPDSKKPQKRVPPSSAGHLRLISTKDIKDRLKDCIFDPSLGQG